MTDISPNFPAKEWACHSGEPLPLELYPAAQRHAAAILEPLRSKLGNRPVHLMSAYRTPAYNHSCGGEPRSYHMGRVDECAQATDIQVHAYTDANGVTHPALTPEAVHAELLLLLPHGSGGLGLYDTFCHVDLGARKWRGDKRTNNKGGANA